MGWIFSKVPVVDGFAFPHVTKRLNVAGRDVTSHLCDLLLRRGYAFNRTADFRTVQDMKVRGACASSASRPHCRRGVSYHRPRQMEPSVNKKAVGSSRNVVENKRFQCVYVLSNRAREFHV